MSASYTRPDGARILVRRSDRCRSQVAVYARGGSRFETLETQGLTHFLEHMLFRGCDAYAGPHDVALAFERLGASFEGATMVDATMLTLDCPSENLTAVTAVLCEVLRAPRFGGLDVERGIVLEELLEDVNEHGQSINADDVLRAHMFGAHPLGLPIAGTATAVESFTESEVRAIYPHTFARPAAIVSVAGSFSDEALFALAHRVADALPEGVPRQTPHWRGHSPGGFAEVGTDDSQCELRLGFLTPGASHADREAFELLVRLVDDGMSTRLYARVCNELGLCYDTHASHDLHEDVGLFAFAGQIAPERAPDLVREWSKIVADLAAGSITPEELNSAKARTRWDAEALLESPSSMLEHEALEALWGTPVDMQAWAARVDALTLADLQRVARVVFIAGAASLVSVGPIGAKRREKLLAAAAPWVS